MKTKIPLVEYWEQLGIKEHIHINTEIWNFAENEEKKLPCTLRGGTLPIISQTLYLWLLNQ